MNLCFGVKSSAFGETIKRSHLRELYILQTINVGAMMGEARCNLPQGTVLLVAIFAVFRMMQIKGLILTFMSLQNKSKH